MLTSRVAQGGGQVGFAQTDVSEEDDVSFVLEELQPEEVLHRHAVDFLGPVPAELFQRFDHREAGGFEAPLDDALAALVVFTFDKPAEVFDVVPLVLGGLLGQFPVVTLHKGQFQIFQVLLEQ